MTAQIDRISAWVLGIYGVRRGADNLEEHISTMDRYAEKTYSELQEDVNFTQSYKDTYYSTYVATRTVFTKESAGWAPLLSMYLSEPGLLISRDSVILDIPEAIRCNQMEKLTQGKITVRDLFSDPYTPKIKIKDIVLQSNGKTKYRLDWPGNVEEQQTISWAYAKGQARRRLAQHQKENAAA